MADDAKLELIAEKGRIEQIKGRIEIIGSESELRDAVYHLTQAGLAIDGWIERRGSQVLG